MLSNLLHLYHGRSEHSGPTVVVGWTCWYSRRRAGQPGSAEPFGGPPPAAAAQPSSHGSAWTRHAAPQPGNREEGGGRKNKYHNERNFNQDSLQCVLRRFAIDPLCARPVPHDMRWMFFYGHLYFLCICSVSMYILITVWWWGGSWTCCQCPARYVCGGTPPAGSADR